MGQTITDRKRAELIIGPPGTGKTHFALIVLGLTALLTSERQDDTTSASQGPAALYSTKFGTMDVCGSETSSRLALLNIKVRSISCVELVTNTNRWRPGCLSQTRIRLWLIPSPTSARRILSFLRALSKSSPSLLTCLQRKSAGEPRTETTLMQLTHSKRSLTSLARTL